jgi:hypothetical protein
MMIVGMGEKKTPKPFIAACNQFKYLDVLAETEKKSMEMDDNHGTADKSSDSNSKANGKLNKGPETDSNNKATKNPVPSDNVDSGKNMTDLSVIKSAILKMMNEVDEDEQRMNMGELGSRLVKRYPDFDVRNYGDTKLSKFLRKFDFIEINSNGKGGSSMWVSLKVSKEPNELKTPELGEVKTQEAKAQETKAQETKVQDSKVQDSKAQDSKSQDSKVLDSKVQEAKGQEAKGQDTKTKETFVTPQKKKRVYRKRVRKSETSSDK